MRVSIRREIPESLGIVSTCLLIAGWTYANNSSLQWLVESFRQASNLYLILVSLFVGVSVVQAVRVYRRGGWEKSNYFVSVYPILRSHPLLLMIGSALSAIALQQLVDLEQLTVILFLLGTYGLLGLYLKPAVWRQGLPVASLGACLVPLSSQLSTGVGIPARILTAHAVEQLLSAWHIAAISSYDIIVLENGAAQVDVPCSGLKTLWVGTIFLLCVTWLEKRKLGGRWLGVCASNLAFLTLANTVRVLILVLVTHILKQPQLAQMLHIPLGLMGLACACALSWLMLQWVPKSGQAKEAIASSELKKQSCRPSSFTEQALLIVFVFALAVTSQFYPPHEEQPLSIASLQWPRQMASERIPLTAPEHHFFDNYPFLHPEKHRFALNNLSGSILLVANTTWRTYHPPEICLLALGLKVDGIERKQLTSTVPARWLSLSDGKISATYWFQSPKQTTDDFLSRLWSDVTRRQKNWVLVSVLFDSYPQPDSPEIQEFATTLHNAIDHTLQVGAGIEEKNARISRLTPLIHRPTLAANKA